jgi:PadR family transcriptional regulator, regulatory protein AphA
MRQTDYVILGLLSEAPLTGYQIKKLVDIRFRFFWSESYGQIYPGLQSLQKRGLIQETDTAAETNRSQKTYQITGDGMSALKNWLIQPVERETVRFEILVKMYFSDLVPADAMISHLRTFQQSHETDLYMIQAMGKDLKTIIEKDPNHPYILRVIDLGEKVNEAYVNWSRETIKFLESRRER